MFNFILTQNSTPIIGWCASLLGKGMEWLYVFFNFIGIENIGLCIIFFTLIIKLLMFPLTIKQQKFSKLSTLMNPELQEIQKKYKGKRDNESMMKMQEETSAVYKKYGTSPTGSCLQLLIQMPILFSLYYIISNVPAYVPQVKDYYEDVSHNIVVDYDYFEYMNQAYDDYVKKDGDEDKYKYIDDMLDSFSKITDKKVIDVLARYSTEQWNNLRDSYENFGELATDLSVVTDEEWDKLLDGISNEDKKKKIEKFIEEKISKETEIAIIDKEFDDKAEEVTVSEKKIMKINEFGPINLSQSPSVVMGWAVLIPILCFLTQWFSSKLVMGANKEQMADNPMGNSMKVMNVVLPLMSAFISLSVPAGLGLYWVCNGVFQIIQQVGVNAYFKTVDVNDIIKNNVEKMNKKLEKRGIDPNKVASFASTNTKNINSKINVKQNNTVSNNANRKYKAGSMAAKANMVKEFNDKNRK